MRKSAQEPEADVVRRVVIEAGRVDKLLAVLQNDVQRRRQHHVLSNDGARIRGRQPGARPFWRHLRD